MTKTINNKRKKNRIQKLRKTTKIKKGGKVIASGGYGCIFRPALKCINRARAKGEISKLMTIKHINEEYTDIVKFKPYLSTIPNYKNYFLIDNVSICKPSKLADSDLDKFEEKCKALKKDGFTSSDINSSLDKIAILNMPDGGLDVGDFIETITKKSQFVVLNSSLIDLLVNGILPMNKLNIYHCDIKESNIVVNKKNGFHTMLIDWGLSAKYDGEKIPDMMLDRPFQYNVPFSIILFNDIFKKKYKSFLIKNPDADYTTVRTFALDYIFLWNEERGLGHTKFMISIMENLFENELTHIPEVDRKEVIKMEFLYYYITEYLTKILVKFTKNGEFLQMDYFENVFLKNIDVWGLVISYYPMLNILHENYSLLKKGELEIFNKLKFIFTHYLFENATEPIDIDNLVKYLRDINALFKQKRKTAKYTSIISFAKTSKNTK
jgi:serine/threonine protein kinase